MKKWIALILSFASAFYFAWVMRLFWQWFMVETFGLPEISMAQAYGVFLLYCLLHSWWLVRLTLHRVVYGDHDSENEDQVNMLLGFIYPFILTFNLGIGAIVHALIS